MFLTKDREYRDTNSTDYRNAGPLHMALRSDRRVPDGDAPDWRQLHSGARAAAAGHCIDRGYRTHRPTCSDSGCVECGGSGHDDSGDRDRRRVGILSAACLRRDSARGAGDCDEHGSRFRRFPGSRTRSKRAGTWTAVPDAVDAGLPLAGRASGDDPAAGRQLPGLADGPRAACPFPFFPSCLCGRHSCSSSR